MRVLASASLFVGNNSAPMYLAVALAVPSTAPDVGPVQYPEKICSPHHLRSVRCDSLVHAALACRNTAHRVACAWTSGRSMRVYRRSC